MTAVFGSKQEKAIYLGVYNGTFLTREAESGRYVWVKRPLTSHPSEVERDRLQHESDVSQILADAGFPCFSDVRRYGSTLACIASNVNERGKTLRQWMDEAGGRIPVESALLVALGVVKMLEEFHRRQLVHNNISPETLWVDPQTLEVCPIDYEFVRETGADPASVFAAIGEIRHFAYISPELTGQLHRKVDYRSDFYALGVILYEMLTKKLPIKAQDPIQWLHAHVARAAVPLHLFDSRIPLPISQIVMKCLSKSPEERYQSAYGLRIDLERCLDKERSGQWMNGFQLAALDRPAYLQISHRFVGRKHEIAELSALLDNMEEPPCKVVFISGEPGIGKTRLVRELEQLQARPDRLFLYGKFDQLNSRSPFRPWIEAFHQWVDLVLTQSEEEIGSWKRLIVEEFGANASVLTQLIPQMEKMIGKQPPAEKLVGIELQNRFETVLTRFLHLFAKKNISVVIVLDDLQWADPGSLKLLDIFLNQQDLSHLLCIAIYRDREAEAGSVWQRALQVTTASGDRTLQIRLEMLSLDETMEWLADTLLCQREQTRELADWLLQRTGGNPYFIQEYLRTLYESEHIWYDADAGQWVWSLSGVEETGVVPNNVADLLITRLGGASRESLQLLKLASCVGHTFDLAAVSGVLNGLGKNAKEAAEELVRLGLIVPCGLDAFSFAHDRVRLAAYSLIPDEEKQRVHYQLGSFLLEQAASAVSDERLFEIANHLNQGKACLDESGIRELVRLNLEAGNRARANAAFDDAFLFYKTGAELLTADSWKTDYHLIYQLKLGCLECAYLAGDLAQAEQLFQELMEHGATLRDRTQAYLIRILMDMRTDRHESAISLGLKALAEYGLRIPEHPSKAKVFMEWMKINPLGAARQIRRLKRLQPATDPDSQAVMDIMLAIGPSCYILNPDLMGYLAVESCRLTLQQGILRNSGTGLVVYAVVTIFLTGDFAAGLKLGEVATDLTQTYGTTADKYFTFFIYGAFLHHWGHPPEESEDYLLQSIAYSVDSGDLAIAGFAVTHLLLSYHVRSVTLDKLKREVERYFIWTDKLKDPHYYDTLILYRHFIRNMQGKSESLYRFDDGAFREDAYVQGLSDDRKKFDYLLCKTQALYLHGQLDQAWEAAREAEQMADLFLGVITGPELEFYYCLILMARWDRLSAKEQRWAKRILRKKRMRFKTWSKTCPSHYWHKYLLIEAEMARIAGSDEKAAVLYQRAIDEAGKNAYVQNEAIANECAARFYKERNNQRAYERHLLAAYQGFLMWGADAKAHLLLRSHPWLEESAGKAETDAMFGQSRQALADSLDVSAVLQASQAISREIVLEDLLRRLITILLHHAGADQAVLLLKKDDRWTVAARGTVVADGIEYRLLEWKPFEEVAELAQRVIDRVARSGEMIVLDNAVADERFGKDPSIAARKIPSVLCMPIVQRNEMTGMIYLENGKSGGVFTPHRVEVLHLLSGQIAISIQNAILYDGLRTENSELEGAVAQTATSLKHSQREAAGALIEKAILQERNRIAGEIHDTIGHTLTSVLLQIEAGKKLIGKQEIATALEKLENSQQQIREGLQDLRRSLFMLKEGDGHSEDFVSSLESFIQKTMTYTGIQVDYEIEEDIQLSAAQKYVLFRALQEGITNGIRHGKARRFAFSLRKRNQQLEFLLRDDGEGADEIVFGFGLSAMNDRVREWNGSMQIESAKGKGCTLTIHLPL